MSTEKILNDAALDGIRFETIRELNGSFTTLPSFGRMLPYRGFSERHKVFIFGDIFKKERYVGAMWEYSPFVHEANSLDGQKLGIANLMEAALLQIPDGYAFQFITVSDRNVSSYLPSSSEALDGPNGDGQSAAAAIDTLCNEQLMFLHLSSKNGLWGEKSVFPRTMRFYITVFHIPRKITFGERSVSAIERVDLESTTMDIVKKTDIFSRNVASFESMMRNNGFGLRRCGPENLISYFHQYLHKNMFREGLDAPAYIPQMDLSSQLFRTFIYTDDTFVQSDGHYYRTSAATNAPQYTAPGIMYKLMEIPGDIHICLTGFVEAQDKEKKALRWKGNFASYGLMNPFGREDNNNSAIAADVDSIEKDILAGKKVLHFSFYVTNVAESYDLANTYAQKVNSKISELEIPMLADNIISQSLFKNSLPFHYAPLDNKNHLSRTFKLPSHSFAQMAPVTGAWLGTQNPGMIGLSRSCEPVYLDFFDGTVPHFIVSGETGTGKSALLNMMAVRFLKRGDRFFIIDMMGSYKKLCSLLSGEYISFNLNDPVSYNPFDCALDKERLLLLSNFVSSIMTRKNEELAQSDIALIDKAIEFTYEKLGLYNRTPELEDFNNVLKSHFGEKGQALSGRLAFYVGKGEYANFFRRSSFNVNNPLIVFDIGGLREAPDLMRAMLFNIMLVIGEQVKKLLGRKWLPIDEAHRIFIESVGADFVDNAFRTYRHYNTAVGVMTQKVSDLLKAGKVGEVCLSQANIQVYFRQPSLSVLDAMGYLGLSEPDAYTTESLKSVMGFYSEAFIHIKRLRSGGSGKGVVRFMSTPLNYAAFTTDPPDKEAYAAIRDETRTNMPSAAEDEIEKETIKAFAGTYPHGVAASLINAADIW